MTKGNGKDRDESWTEVVDEQLRAGLLEWRPRFAPRTAFWFLRHGRTISNLRWLCQGHEDIVLDDLGREQAHRAGVHLRRAKLRRIVSSDLKRAYETARLAAVAAAAPVPTLDPGLRERSFGSHEGIASPYTAWMSPASDSESLEAFTRRILAAVEAAVDGEDVLVCSHGGSLRALAAGLGINLEPWCYDNAVPLRFDRVGTKWHWSALR